MFRGGYHSGFPPKAPTSDDNIQKAIKQSIVNKARRNQNINTSRWRKYHDIQQGDKVLILRAMRSGKYQSIYEPEPYIVIHQNGARYQLLRQSDNYTTFRHINDLKPYHGTHQEMPQQHHILSRRWSSPITNAPQIVQRTSSQQPHQSSPVPHRSSTPTPPTQSTKIPRLILKNTNNEWERQANRPKRQIKAPARYTEQ